MRSAREKRRFASFRLMRRPAPRARVPAGTMEVGLLHHPAGRRDEILPDAVADAAAARMQHHPEAFAFVEAKLDEMVAAAERAHLPHPFPFVIALHLRDSRIFSNDLRKTLRKRGARLAARACLAVLVEPHGHGMLDRGTYAREAVGKLLRRERKAHGVHAAADIDSHRRGDDRAPRRYDRAHRRADP